MTTPTCIICGPAFIGKCPHKMSSKEMVEAVLSWGSDDFGHDCTALLEAESRALQDIGEKFLLEKMAFAEAQDRIRVLEEALKSICGDRCHPEHNPCEALIALRGEKS